MATASEAVLIASESSWVERVRYFRLDAAIAVMNEDPLTDSHAERVAYATKVINGQDNLHDYALGVATSDPVLANMTPNNPPDWGVTDADMLFTVNSLFNAFAGIST